MNKLIKSLLFLTLCCVSLVSCKEDSTIDRLLVIINCRFQDGIDKSCVSDEVFSFYNVSTGVTERYSDAEDINLLPGLYSLTYTAKYQTVEATVDNKQNTVIRKIEGYKADISFDGSSAIELDVYIKNERKGLVIQEVFFTGSLYESGNQYHGDQYIKIFNNSDSVIYADGLAIVESKFLSITRYECTPNIMSNHFPVQCVYVIPGNGSEHPVKPGESVLLCDIAIDHRTINPNSIDLRNADFEWYDVSSIASFQDIDSEYAPNLDKWCCYTNTIWLLHNRGFRAYAIARMQCDMETFLKDYVYNYSYVIVSSTGRFESEGSDAWMLPNEWIEDAVQCSVEADYVWSVMDTKLDRGYAHCGTMDGDKTRYFKSIRRKLLYITPDGRQVLKDTDNSFEDFNNECVPSVFEQQHASISADGVKATALTYDGVTPVE